MSKKGSFWTPEEDAELLRRYNSEPRNIIAADLGRTLDGMADRYRRLIAGGGKAEKRPPPEPHKTLTLHEIAVANVRHVGACMREAGVTNLADLASYYRSRFELAVEPGASVMRHQPTSFADWRSCVGSQASMCEGN